MTPEYSSPVRSNEEARVRAVLGPTNTGKTHLAVERLCAHSSGVMGFPLRLLAREVYDRVVAIKGADSVALITGEERIEPKGARWYLCTAESMPETYGPETRDFAFAAIDEVQLGTDPARGHVFTDRLLGRRGREETMVLGSAAMAPVVRKLLPRAEIASRPRFSTLSFAGAKKLSRLPPRSAIVAFSVEEVYAVAEMLRRQRGGAAVVMGALSPATRNAQVEMFQSGEVDYLVATDAIGMGLNLDVGHIAFASLRKYDGRRRRRLDISEMAQIAGRAGRHQRDGTFGTVAGNGQEFTPEEIEAIEEHRMPEIETLYWRDPHPRTASVDQLIADLEARPTHPALIPAPEAIDLAVLKQLAADAEVSQGLAPRQVARLWDVASLPDFQSLGPEHHARYVAGFWRHLRPDGGRLPRAMVADQLVRLDSKKGDVDAIAARIASVRIWTYATTRADWVEDRDEMAERARALEAKLSDALHDALRQRFVDRRSSVLFRNLGKPQLAPKVSLDAEGLVLVDDEPIGSMAGFRFSVSPSAPVSERRMLLAAAERYLGGIMDDKAKAVAGASDDAFAVECDGDGAPRLICGGSLIGHLTRGSDLLSPRLELDAATSGIEAKAKEDMRARAEAWLAGEIEKALGGLQELHRRSSDPETAGELRALSVRLVEAAGAQRRKAISDVIRQFTRELRAEGRKLGIVFGALDIFHFQALKPRACFWRDALHSVWHGHPTQTLPPESAVHLPDWNFRDDSAALLAGYTRAGSEWLRIDLAERLVRQAHEKRSGGETVEMAMEYPTSLGLGEASYAALLARAGFSRIEPPAEAAVSPDAAPLDGESVDQGQAGEAVNSPEPSVEAPDRPDAPVEGEGSEPAVADSAEADSVGDAQAGGEPVEGGADEAEASGGENGQPPLGTLWFAWGAREARGRRRGDGRNKAKGRKPNRGAKPGKPKGPRGQGKGGSQPQPTAKSALAEALGEQLAALKDKS